MDKGIIQKLLDFGLSEKEARIYISLLELEVATAFETAKHAGINRSSAYVVLESLKKKGLVAVSEDKKVSRYVASAPDILLQSASLEAKRHQDIKAGIESVIPELKALHKDTKMKPVVKVFEGKNGLISLFEDSLYAKEREIRIVSSLEKIFALLPEYVPNYIQRRWKKRIKMFGIHPSKPALMQYEKMEKESDDEAIFIPEENYKMPADFAIYDNKIAYMTGDNGGFGVIIESTDMANAMKSIFDLAHKEAKRIAAKNK
jgi:sugar-specific transcriptional regulator TrmB